jgi:hypothetical protein
MYMLFGGLQNSTCRSSYKYIDNLELLFIKYIIVRFINNSACQSQYDPLFEETNEVQPDRDIKFSLMSRATR